MAVNLCFSNVLGMNVLPKKGTLQDQVLDFKTLHPGRVVLIRVGELYEAHCVDAVILVESALCSSCKNDLKTCVSVQRLQTVLNHLIRCGFEIAIFEESEVICTPRHRYLSQIVSSANPQYGVLEASDTPKALQIVAVEVHADASVTACALDIQMRLCRKFSCVSMNVVSALIAGAAHPLYVLRSRPNFVPRDIEVVIVGGDPHADIAERVVSKVCIDLHISPSDFRKVSARMSRASPLTRFTQLQLGLIDESTTGVPDLVNFCIPRSSTAVVRHQVRSWLVEPPSDDEVAAIRAVIDFLQRTRNGLPPLATSPPGLHENYIRRGQGPVAILDAIKVNTSALAKMETELSLLVEAVARNVGYIVPTAAKFAALYDTIQTRIVDAYKQRDARGPYFELSLRSKSANISKALAELESTNSTLDAILSAFIEEEIIRDSRGVSLRGRSDGQNKLPVQDKSNRILPLQYTTYELRKAEEAVAAAARAALDIEARDINACYEHLASFLPTVCVVDGVVRRLQALIDHVRFSANKGWQRALKGEQTFEIKGLVPYWMDRSTAVLNGFAMSMGSTTVVTAPNAGGKTTLLRAVAALIALDQAGLSAPCDSATIPRVDNLFLRIGNLDSAVERRSSFSAEMIDMRTIMEAPGQTVALIDEPCRGTSTEEGMRLLAAIIEHMPPNVTSMISTHYHDVAKNASVQKLQLGAEVVRDDCQPTFKLTTGVCTNSLALRVALAVGLPIPIIQSARPCDDIEILLMTIFADKAQSFERLREGETAPPNLTSVLYILDTVDGIYVGESDAFVTRLRTHERTKPRIRSVFYAHIDNKTRAREIETALLKELRFHNVVLLSDADAAHGV